MLRESGFDTRAALVSSITPCALDLSLFARADPEPNRCYDSRDSDHCGNCELGGVIYSSPSDNSRFETR